MDVTSVRFRNRLVALSDLIMATGIMSATPKKTASHIITVTKIVTVIKKKKTVVGTVFECCEMSYNSCKRAHESFLSCFTMFDSHSLPKVVPVTLLILHN